MLLIIPFFHQFFTVEPLAVDPSSLPKYPPSKEIDAKLRDEEAKKLVLYIMSHSFAKFENLFACFVKITSSISIGKFFFKNYDIGRMGNYLKYC